MAHPTVVINSVTYQNVPQVQIPKSGSGTATFYDNSECDAAAGNVQICSGRYETNSSSYVATNLSVKVTKAGTYKCTWSMDRNTTSGTNGSRLYKGSTAQGTAHTSWTHNGATCEETLTLAANDTVTVYARARNTSYYVGVSNLIVEEQ